MPKWNLSGAGSRREGTCHEAITSSTLYIALPFYTDTDIWLFMLPRGGCQEEGEHAGRAVQDCGREACRACKV